VATGRILRILVADDYEVVRAGVCALVSYNPLWTVCGEAGNGEETVEQVRKLKPDLVILDISMPILTGIAAARQIREIAPETKIIIFTMHESLQLELAARQAGADAVITKRMAVVSLVSAIERLFDGSASDLTENSRASDVQLK